MVSQYQTIIIINITIKNFMMIILSTNFLSTSTLYQPKLNFLSINNALLNIYC